MDLKKILLVWPLLFVAFPAFGGDIHWKSDFTFYGDNTEFFEPFRTGETLLGQQGKSFLEAGLGTKTFLRIGVFGDFRSQSAIPPTVDVRPIFSFDYREGGTRLIIGSLETKGRHGFLEPLEVSFLEFTRPIEYGFQWIQEDPGFKADLFLDWHQLNTPTQPESFDYGGTAAGILTDTFTLEAQLHGFHDGGQQYYTVVINNWVGAVGFRWKLPGLIGQTRFDGFGIGSGYLDGGNTTQTQFGGGGYLRATVDPDDKLSFFGTGWLGRDLYSQEGDANYASYSSPDSTTVDQLHAFVRHDRFYGELGAERTFPMEGGARFTAGFRLHFIDELTAYSYRLMVTAPFDLFLLSVDEKGRKQDGSRD